MSGLTGDSRDQALAQLREAFGRAAVLGCTCTPDADFRVEKTQPQVTARLIHAPGCPAYETGRPAELYAGAFQDSERASEQETMLAMRAALAHWAAAGCGMAAVPGVRGAARDDPAVARAQARAQLREAASRAAEPAGASSVFAGDGVTVTAHGGQRGHGTVGHARTIAMTASAGPEQPARQQAPEPAGTVPGAALRVSHADRDDVTELLRQAAGDGRLTSGELDERIEAAALAVTYGELVTLTADLPGAVITVPAAPQVRHASRSAPGLVRLAGTCDHGGRRQRFIRDGSCRRCGGPAYPYPYPDPRLTVLLSAVLFWLVVALTIVAVTH